MLAKRFQEVIKRRSVAAAERSKAHAARDEFIKAKFGELNTSFSDMVTAVSGDHPKLILVKTPVTDTITTRTFPTLDKTVIELRSTLNGAVETVLFTPALEFVAESQFGVITVVAEGFTVDLGGDTTTPVLKSILNRGVVMRGKKTASLVVEVGKRFKVLDEELLEELLARLLIRGEDRP